jgi:uncharacterized membrane protein YphA (DoxX/SURF4 family)
MSKNVPPQPIRLMIFALYVGVLIGASFLALGHWPPLSAKGLWFYTGIVSLILGNLLITPFFTTPKDAIGNVIVAAFALIAAADWKAWDNSNKTVFIIAGMFLVLTMGTAAGTILLKDSRSPTAQLWAKSFALFCEASGNQRTVFSVVILSAIYLFHRGSPRETLVITLAWAITIAIRPDEKIVRTWTKLRSLWRSEPSIDIIGELVACQSPDIIIFRQNGAQKTEFGTVLLVKDPRESIKVAFALDHVGRDEGLLVRAIQLDVPDGFLGSSALDRMSDGQIARISDGALTSIADAAESLGRRQKEFVGLVARDTSVDRLFFDVVQERDLEEGRLVEVSIGKNAVLYQVINGLTREEIVYQKNTFGYARAQARKVGIWDAGKKRFQVAKWLPQLNAAVYLKAKEGTTPDPEAIGHFPGSSYPLGIKSIHNLVTHNTAILGILGVGKSMLAIELVERMLAAGIKVVCLDLTNQYARELSDFYDAAAEAPKLETIRKAGEVDSDEFDEDPEKGGSIPKLTEALHQDLVEFLDPSNPRKLKIYNPAQIVATKQLREPKTFMVDGQWQRRAALWTVTPVEVTRIVAEALLDILQADMSDQAKACLVLEEAHSLVPEFTAVAAEGDKAATNRTSRAILQGRKYGFGCLIVTQRTANVTKTILNQCNTVFAMRTFDDTGKEFLANYIGGDYAAILPLLDERQAVFFGKASTCENPVLIRLNDQNDFRAGFREIHPPPPLPEIEVIEGIVVEAVDPLSLDEPEPANHELDDDDIPF